MLFPFSDFRCLKFLGSRHPTLVLPLVSELLSTHPYFDTPEPDMDDPACILLTDQVIHPYTVPSLPLNPNHPALILATTTIIMNSNNDNNNNNSSNQK